MLKLKQETSILYSNMPTKLSLLFSFLKKVKKPLFLEASVSILRPNHRRIWIFFHVTLTIFRSISYTTPQFTPWRGQWPSIPFRITVLFTRFRIPAGPRWFISWDLPWIGWWFRNRSYSHHLTQCNLRGSLSLRTGGKKTKWTNHSLGSWQR